MNRENDFSGTGQPAFRPSLRTRLATPRTIAYTHWMRALQTCAIAVSVLVLEAVAPSMATAQDASEILRRTAETYRNLHSLEIEGTLSSQVSRGEKLYGVAWTISLAQADVTMLPPESAVPALPQLIRRIHREVRPVGASSAAAPDREEIPDDVAQSLPVDWSSFDRMDSSVDQSRTTGEDTVTLAGEARRCWLIEVLYRAGSRARSAHGRPVRYWIDQSSNHVLRQEFSQRAPAQGETVEWIFSVTSIATNKPAPEWAVDALPQLAGSERAVWVGREAPDFLLTALDGREVNLAGLRGKVVVLSFWASWCVPCKDEMLVLEKLRADLPPDEFEIWGVNNESGEIAHKWLAQYGRSLPTLSDVELKAYQAYEVEKIPVSVVIDARGRVVSYVEGVRGEFYFRGVLKKALAAQ